MYVVFGVGPLSKSFSATYHGEFSTQTRALELTTVCLEAQLDLLL